MRQTPVNRKCIGIAAVLFAVSASLSCSHPPVEQNEPAVVGGLNQPLSSLNQVIKSSAHDLSVAANKIRASGTNRKSGYRDLAIGRICSLNVSYKWLLDGKMLPIEGERTPLPKPISPKTSQEMTVHVVAPGQAGKYELRVTLVQEGVTWFMTRATPTLRFLSQFADE